METKFCLRCMEEKAISEFHNNKAAKDKLRPYCKICAKNASRNWQKENLEKVKEHNKKYYEKHLEKCKETSKNWGAKNAELARIRTKKWKGYNLEKVKENDKKWREKNSEKISIKHKKMTEKLPDWLIASRLQLHVSDVEKYPELFKAKRLIIQIKRECTNQQKRKVS